MFFKNKKGFTLVELLAVIVILAIIALISVPVIVSLIESSRKGAAENVCHSIEEASNNFFAMVLTGDKNITDIQFECDGSKCMSEYGELALKGSVPESGKINIDVVGKVTVVEPLKINGYSCVKTDDIYDCNK